MNIYIATRLSLSSIPDSSALPREEAARPERHLKAMEVAITRPLLTALMTPGSLPRPFLALGCKELFVSRLMGSAKTPWKSFPGSDEMVDGGLTRWRRSASSYTAPPQNSRGILIPRSRARAQIAQSASLVLHDSPLSFFRTTPATMYIIANTGAFAEIGQSRTSVDAALAAEPGCTLGFQWRKSNPSSRVELQGGVTPRAGWLVL